MNLGDRVKNIPAKVFWTAIAIVLVGLCIFAFINTRQQSFEAKVKSVTTQLRCMECEGLSINESDTQTSKTIAKDVEKRVKNGESKQQIIDHYEDIYGEYIRLAPTGKNGNWLIYVVPTFFIIVLVSAIFLSITQKGSKKTQVIFWSIAGVLFLIGLGVFINNSNTAGTNQATQTETKSDEQILKESVEKNPTAQGYRNLALVQFANDNYIDALKNFDRASKLDPTDADSMAHAAYIIFQAGQDDNAKTRIDAAVAANDQSVSAHFFRGLIYREAITSSDTEKAANNEIAAIEFSKVKSLAPNSEYAKQINELPED